MLGNFRKATSELAWIAVTCIKSVFKVFLERNETWVCTMLLCNGRIMLFRNEERKNVILANVYIAHGIVVVHQTIGWQRKKLSAFLSLWPDKTVELNSDPGDFVNLIQLLPVFTLWSHGILTHEYNDR